MNLVNSSQWFLTQPSPSPAGPSKGLGCSNTWQAETGRITQMVITVLIFLVGVSLNSLVVYALAWRGRGRLTRRGSLGQGETRGASSFRVYVVNLALADLVLLLRTPLMLAYLAHSCSWPVGKLACRLVIFLRGLGLYAAAFLLCAVAVERCLCLLRPVWSSLKRPRWAVPLVCGLLWGWLLPWLPLTSTLPTCWRSTMARLYRVLFLTMLLFLSCWVPYFTCRFLRALAVGRPERAGLYRASFTGAYVSLFLVYLKSSLNPVLYVFAARGLGRTVRASLPPPSRESSTMTILTPGVDGP
uniref:leukotriene B4 receptor 2-like n=1 Tax=Oncorhynchus gorbuscha TaxID=8017 RepID=UPI001EAF72CB|nr:leukotriene B4 receptor 2-like [Oncorhynchus gorbuscha]